MIKLVNKPTVRFSRRQEEIRWKTVTATTAESVKGLFPIGRRPRRNPFATDYPLQITSQKICRAWREIIFGEEDTTD